MTSYGAVHLCWTPSIMPVHGVIVPAKLLDLRLLMTDQAASAERHACVAKIGCKMLQGSAESGWPIAAVKADPAAP